MNTETINAIKEALVPVAAKIGQGAEYGWAIVVKQQYISGIGSLILSFFLFLGSILGTTWVIKGWPKTEKYDDARFGYFMLGMISVFMAGFGVSLLVLGIQHLLNPDYYALDFFIHLGSHTN